LEVPGHRQPVHVRDAQSLQRHARLFRLDRRHWLSAFLPKILSSSIYTSGGTAVFIVWDEDDNSAGNSVPLLVISPYTASGTRYGAAVNH
jgi:hypothetical protein